MKRFVISTLALAVLAVTGLAGGATQHAISLTGTGPQPTELKIGWGDSVVFTNADTVARTLLIPRLEVTTSIPPGGTFSQTFSGREGNYPFRQQIGNRAVPGTISLEVAGQLKLGVTPGVVPFGRSIRVSGASPYAESPVQLEVRPAGAGAWQPLVESSADASGAFSETTSLSRGGSIRASAAAGQLRSNPVTVAVRPLMTVRANPRRASVGRFVRLAARLRPARAADSAMLERFDARRKSWVRFKTVKVGRSGTASFSLRATKGTTRLRVVVRRNAVAPGYVTPTTRSITIVGR